MSLSTRSISLRAKNVHTAYSGDAKPRAGSRLPWLESMNLSNDFYPPIGGQQAPCELIDQFTMVFPDEAGILKRKKRTGFPGFD